MKKQEFLKESAKTIQGISEDVRDFLVILENSEESQVLNFEGIEQYEQFQLLVKEGYAEKDYRNYSITEKGSQLLEGVEFYREDPKKFDKVINEDTTNNIVIEYKHHDEEKNLIENAIASFEVETDGLPVIVVTEDAYANLIHRQRGQHWRQYLGEDGRNLIRQKKLERFYVQDDSTGRRYLYISPKK
jgi:hypothetical protein